jgi:hypothetical protein
MIKIAYLNNSVPVHSYRPLYGISLSTWYLFSWIVGLSHIQPGDAITPPCSLDGHSH